MTAAAYPDGAPPNDALLIQLVRGALGRASRSRGWPRINVSSCSLVVTLHGTVNGERQKGEIEAAARAVPGVQDVSNELRVARP